MSTFNFRSISFHRLAVNEPPWSDEITDGTPNKDSHPWRNPVAAAEADASFKGMH